MYTERSFQQLAVSERWRKAMAATANYGLAQSTWSAYRTAAKMLEKCANAVGISMDFPLTENQVLAFVSWMLNRGLSSSTMDTYLAGIRQVHLVNGVNLPCLRTPLVKLVLEGRKHQDTAKKRAGLTTVRLPVTPKVLLLLKAELKASSMPKVDKLLCWAVATICFSGALRIHEVLCRKESSFDPHCTLLGRDITVRDTWIRKEKVPILQLRLKSEKTDRIGADTILDIYETKGQLCPLRAYKKWSAAAKEMGKCLPAFFTSEGKPLTGHGFNKLLKDCLGKHLDYKKGKVTSHSFRSGIASLVASLGYTDEEIQALGRWSSAAYNSYIKLPRTRRLQMAREIGSLNL